MTMYWSVHIVADRAEPTGLVLRVDVLAYAVDVGTVDDT